MIRLTELDDRLAGPDGERHRAELDARLQLAALRLKTSQSRPLPRTEFGAVQACAQAVDAARNVLAGVIPAAPSAFSSTGSGVARR